MSALAAPANFEINVITREGFDRLQRELDELAGAGRDQAAARLRTARLDGNDPAENAELRDALEARERLERRIWELEERLSGVRVAEPATRDGVARVGTRVRLRGQRTGVLEFTLVGAGEADLERDRISVVAPIGQAVAGRRVGDTIDVETPRRRVRFEVISVTPEGDPHVSDERIAA